MFRTIISWIIKNSVWEEHYKCRSQFNRMLFVTLIKKNICYCSRKWNELKRKRLPLLYLFVPTKLSHSFWSDLVTPQSSSLYTQMRQLPTLHRRWWHPSVYGRIDFYVWVLSITTDKYKGMLFAQRSPTRRVMVICGYSIWFIVI